MANTKKQGIIIGYFLILTSLIFLTSNTYGRKIAEMESNNRSNNIYQFNVKNIDNQVKSLKDYKGQVLLITNVASYCGYTPQYKGLEELFHKYKNMGFQVLAFPCNQFGSQEPGTNAEIKQFCESKYDITFPIFDKIDVNGEKEVDLYTFLKNNAEPKNKDIEWNFTKFLINKKGEVVKRYTSAIKPEDIEKDIKIELSKLSK